MEQPRPMDAGDRAGRAATGSGTERRLTLPPAVAGALLDALAVLMPVECAGCGAPDRTLCLSCLAALRPHPVQRHLPDGTPVVAALEYSGVPRAVVLEFKEQHRTDVARVLADALSAAIGAAGTRAGAAGAELAPVPSSSAAVRRRGYDPVRLLLRRARLPAGRVLRRVRTAAAQKTLSLSERGRNAVGTLRAARPLSGQRLLLVDDVLTTGATLQEAARAVRAAGGTVAGAAVLAFTPLRSGAPDSMSESPGTYPPEQTRFVPRR